MLDQCGVCVCVCFIRRIHFKFCNLINKNVQSNLQPKHNFGMSLFALDDISIFSVNECCPLLEAGLN